jgi:WD40 repeat protein
VAFSQDGGIAALASEDGFIAAWDLGQGQQLIGVPSGGDVSVDSLALSSDGQVLVSGDKNGDIILWDVASGEILESISNAHFGSVRVLNFSPDGEGLVSGGADGQLLIWSFQPISDVERACRIANRNLSLEEWSRFMILDDAYQRTCPDLPAGE